MSYVADGLWPDYNDGSWPSCCSGPAFDEVEVFYYYDADEYFLSIPLFILSV